MRITPSGVWGVEEASNNATLLPSLRHISLSWCDASAEAQEDAWWQPYSEGDGNKMWCITHERSRDVITEEWAGFIKHITDTFWMTSLLVMRLLQRTQHLLPCYLYWKYADMLDCCSGPGGADELLYSHLLYINFSYYFKILFIYFIFHRILDISILLLIDYPFSPLCSE